MTVATGVLLISGLAACTPQPTAPDAAQPTPTVTVTVTSTPEPTATPTATALPAGTEPVLATPSAFSSTEGVEGFGTAQPARIYQGGDPTGEVRGITWINWGDPTAYGYGTACYVGPNQGVADCRETPAVVIASNLGSCGGVPAYENVGWWFPGVEGDKNSAEGSDIRDCQYGAGD
ncbi:hypothetical protein ACFRFH_19450 [Leifsonia sp. NPDC056824]|uniref:hypothetical protein n=1 Tax=Leifsonia sp. NPDC056824 TaxID=3345953 RepID=UPI0036C8462D